MPRFLTGEWVEAINGSLDGVHLPGPGPEAGLAAQDGRFRVAQEVRGGPDGDVRLVLQAVDGALSFALTPLDQPGGPGGPGGPSAGDGVEVTITIGYADAVALSRGELSPAEALAGGRVRARGDLSVLVAGQELLAAAREHTRAVDAETTY